jgi:hypothetical protein
MYKYLRTLKSNVAVKTSIYRCLRSSSALEGYHHYLRLFIGSLARATGQRMMDRSLRLHGFDCRWTLRAMRRAGLAYRGSRHFNAVLLDDLYSAILTRDPSLARRVMPLYRSLSAGTGVVQRGSYYAMKHVTDFLN